MDLIRINARALVLFIILVKASSVEAFEALSFIMRHYKATHAPIGPNELAFILSISSIDRQRALVSLIIDTSANN